jgi:hypothetical protein
MNNKDLFKNILNWTFAKQGSGFDEKELFKKYQIDSNWYLKIFRSNPVESENLVCHLYYDDKNNRHFHILTAKGISEYYKLNKPWHEKWIGKIIFIIIGVVITLILNEFWSYLVSR